MKFDYSSFSADGLNRNRDTVGIVQGVFQDKPILCRAYQASNGDLVIAGFMGKNKAYNRLWVANVWLEKDNQLRFYFGFESKPKRNGASDLVFDPDLYFEKAPKHLFTPLPDNDHRPPIKVNLCLRCNSPFDGDECHSCEREFSRKLDY